MKFVIKIIFAMVASSTLARPLKVTVIGDSISAPDAYPVPKYNWPTELGRRLDKDGNKLFEITNCAVPGTSI